MHQKTPRLLLVLLSLLFVWTVLLLFRALQDPKARMQEMSHSEPISIVGEYRLQVDQAFRPFTEDTVFDVTVPTTVYLRGHFTRDIDKNQAVILRVNNLRAQLFVNGRKVFSFGEEETYPDFIHSAGSVYTSFSSPGISTADRIDVILSNAYTNSLSTAFSDFFRSMSTGSEHAAYAGLIRERSADLLIGCLSVIIGLIMLIAAAYMGRLQAGGMARYAYLAGFIMASGIWFVADSPVISLFIPYPAFNEILYTLGIFIMAVLFLLYALTLVTGKLRRVLLAETSVAIAAMAVSVLLQFFGVADLYAMLTYHVAIIIVSIFLYSVCLLYEVVRLRSQAARMALGPLLILFLGALADLINYFFGFYLYNVGYKLAFLVFAALQLVRTLRMIRESVEKMRRYTQMEKDLLQSRISVMLSQIKPHFLYNALNGISALCMSEPQKAEEAINTLSSYLSENIQALEAQTPIPFRQELEHIRNYVRIEQMRFGDRLRFVYEIGYEDFWVPTLSLQTLVENAVRHGVSLCPQGGTVTLKTQWERDFAVIVITDDGVGFDPSAPGQGIGIANAKLRLEHMVNAQLSLRSAPSRGTTVTIRIPMTQEDVT